MSTTVTLHVYSGRPDPSWQLSERDESQLREQLESANQLVDRKPSGVLGGLGYRGLSIRRAVDAPAGPLSLFVNEGILDQGAGLPNVASNLEPWLLETSRGAIDDELIAHARQAMNRPLIKPLAAQLENFAVAGGCPPCVAADAPGYNPTNWNTPAVQPFNNCYNYANDLPTNTFAQPGRASGHQATTMACNNVSPAAISDGLSTAGNFTAPLAAKAGWYVALVVWPNRDYHWYRQDNVGCWSHKPGQTAARNVDNAGKQIADPGSCDRGPYSDFCGYMVTRRGVIIK